MKKRRENGVYYTNSGNPFCSDFFQAWTDEHNIGEGIVLEPFAGSNHIPSMLNYLTFDSYDINPGSEGIKKQDTIRNFPQGYGACITNPPWLYKASARRRGLPFSYEYDDLYKHCLQLCLKNCDFVAALLPASFFNSNLFQNRLHSISFITKKLFIETENPVCLALFDKEQNEGDDFFIYENSDLIGSYSELRKHLPPGSARADIKFNDPNGRLGLIAIDNTREDSIKFCEGKKISGEIKYSSRSITKIHGVNANKAFLKRVNECLKDFRESTRDIFLTPFKGVRTDGSYRRRIDYRLARDIISHCL